MITDPANVQIEIDLDKQQKAKQYARINRRLMLVDLIISSVYLIAWLVFGWTHELKNLLLRYTSNVWILLAMYVTFFWDY